MSRRMRSTTTMTVAIEVDLHFLIRQVDPQRVLMLAQREWYYTYWGLPRQVGWYLALEGLTPEKVRAMLIPQIDAIAGFGSKRSTQIFEAAQAWIPSSTPDFPVSLEQQED